jgi:hypothetical protein
MKRDYDSKMREVEYQPGDFVYVLDTAHIKGRAKKLDPPGKAQELGVVLVLWIWRRSHIALNNLLSKFRPCSVRTEKRHPKRANNSFTAALAVFRCL